MPRKIRELMRDLERAGFLYLGGGKGSHRKYIHPSGVRMTLSGNTGSDAKRYQEKAVREAIKQVTQ